MGDRCYMSVTVPREYAHLFEKTGFVIDDNDEAQGPIVKMIDEEANYAYSVGCEEDGFGEMPKGFPYYGAHGSGGGYNAGLFATDGERMVVVDCLSDEKPVARVDADGEVDADSLVQVRDYLSVLAAAKQHLQGLATNAAL